MKDYGPDLTKAIKDDLSKEIAAFDEKATLAEIEREAVGQKPIDAYLEWRETRDQHFKQEPADANPDVLSEEDAVNLDKPDLPSEFAEAKQAVDDLLSFRELQVWKLTMRKGLSHKQVASLLHISEGTVETYLQRAKNKVRDYINGQTSRDLGEDTDTTGC